MQRLLGSLGVHWLYVIILPGFLFGWLAAREAAWVPDQTRRRRIARSLLFGSLALAILIAVVRRHEPAEPDSRAPASSAVPADPKSRR